MRISQEVKGVIMRNLCGTIFYIKTNVLQDFRICMSVPLSNIWNSIHKKVKQHWGRVEKKRWL